MTMLLIDNHNVTDPTINLALEEHCYRNLDSGHEYLLFYTNEPSIIIGNHQNPFQEINLALAVPKQIRPIRRISGGGAVYHDGGNLNFSFITDFGDEKLDYFKKLLQPLLETLIRLGVPAQLTAKNNIVVKKKKVSGTSQHSNIRRMLSHGTLLFDADLDLLRRLLQSTLKITHSRAVASVPSSVTNISAHLSRPTDKKAFMAELVAGISKSLGELQEYQLRPADWDAVRRLAEDKYRSWEWTFGRSPEFTVTHHFQLDSADVDVHIRVKNAVIREIRIPGNQVVPMQIDQKFEKLIGERYNPLQPNLLPESGPQYPC